MQWVADECDKVKDALPFRYSNETTNWGRVNGATAYALKARALLYKASALNNPTGEQSWWQAAAQAAQDFIDKNAQQSNPYQLYATGNPENDYYECFTTNPVYNNEIILSRSVWNTNKVEQVFLPVGFTGKFSAAGRTSPTQNFVDCFEMLDGKRIDEGGGDYAYDAQNPYVNRDPRLAASILYHGVDWNDGTINVIKGQRDNPIGNANVTPTGYYLRKYMPEEILANNHGGTAFRNWIFIRYAEILLDYAEAINEVSPNNYKEALAVIQPIRDRVGMTLQLENRADLQSQDAARKFIRRERTIELAFEDHRAWDVRRWGVAKEALARDIYGVDVVRENGQTKYVRKIAQPRVFEDKMYLYPIPEGEVWKTNIENNPGWN